MNVFFFLSQSSNYQRIPYRTDQIKSETGISTITGLIIASRVTLILRKPTLKSLELNINSENQFKRDKTPILCSF